jgi:hypothetical protein
LRPKAPWDEQKITEYEPYSTIALVELRWMLMEHFDEDEVRKLSNDLEVNYKRLPGADQGGTARELVLYLARRERLNELIDACAYERPGFPWQETLDHSDEQRTAEEMVEPTIELMTLRERLSAFSENQLRDLCLELRMDYDDIAGANEGSELVLYCERRGRIPELVGACARLHPELPW